MDGAIEIRCRTYGSTSLNLTVRVSIVMLIETRVGWRVQVSRVQVWAIKSSPMMFPYLFGQVTGLGLDHIKVTCHRSQHTTVLDYKCDHQWPVATTHPCRIRIGKAERGEDRPSCLSSKKVRFHFLLYVYYTKLIPEAHWARKPPTMGVFSCLLPFIHLETNRPQHTTPPSFEMRDGGFPFPTSVWRSGPVFETRDPWTRTETSLPKIGLFKRPDRTSVNQSQSVFFGYKTGLNWLRFRLVANWSRPVLQ